MKEGSRNRSLARAMTPPETGQVIDEELANETGGGKQESVKSTAGDGLFGIFSFKGMTE